jgi:LCP family protein required for cell wall assembly
MCYIRSDLDNNAPAVRGQGRSPSVAALLSFLWPGLGQLYSGKRRQAALFAVPMGLIALVLVVELWREGSLVFATRVFAQRTIGLAVVAVLILVGVWRLAAVVLAYAGGEGRPTRRILDRIVVVALVLTIVVTHVVASGIALGASNFGDNMFKQPPTGGLAADMATPSLKPGDTPGPTAEPRRPFNMNQRVTILFTGYDSAPDRGETLYDALMIVSYDPATSTVQMLSVPRDSTSFPMYFGRHDVVPTSLRLNSIPTAVRKGAMTGSPDSPYMTLVNEVSYLVGIHIDYFAAMDMLGGFVRLIDLVGGIDVNNPTAIDDYYYDWLDKSTPGFYLAAGPQHLDGRHALAYVRSRKSAGDNDFGRSSRQQEVLINMLHKMAQPGALLAVPSIVSTIGSSLTTGCVPAGPDCTFPSDRLPDYVGIGQKIPKENIKQQTLSPDQDLSKYLGNGALCLYNDKVAALSKQLFGADSLWNGKPLPNNTCP